MLSLLQNEWIEFMRLFADNATLGHNISSVQDIHNVSAQSSNDYQPSPRHGQKPLQI